MSTKEVKIAQLVVLLFIGIIFWKGYKLFNFERLKIITLGWIVISSVFLFDLIANYFSPTSNTQTGLTQFEKCIFVSEIIIDLIGGYILLKGTYSHLSTFKNLYIINFFSTDNNFRRVFLYLLTIVLSIIYLFNNHNSLLIIIGVMYSFLMFISLFALHIYLKKMAERYNGSKFLTVSSLTFSVLQLFGILLVIQHTIFPNLILIITILFIIGLLSKVGVLYGLIDVFVKQNEANKLNLKEKEVIEDRNRIFHDIILVCDDIERVIDATLEEQQSAKKKIDRDLELSINYVNSMNLSIKSIISSEKEFAHLDLNKKKKPEVTNLNTLIQLTVRILSKKDLDGIKIEFRPGAKSNIFCFPSDIIRVIQNLIKNSKEALKTINNGEILIETHKKEIDKNKYVFLSFKDNGIGIPSNIKKYVWDFGFSTKIGNEISGIGLYNVKDILETHKASIEIIEGLYSSGVGFLIKFPHVTQNINN